MYAPPPPLRPSSAHVTGVHADRSSTHRTGFWGDSFYQSDRDLDILDHLTAELGCSPLYTASDDALLRTQLNANDNLTRKFEEMASGARDADPEIAFWGPQLVVVVLGVVAIGCGATLSPAHRAYMRSALRSRLGVYDKAKKDLREALDVYEDGKSIELRGLGLYDTVKLMEAVRPFKLHPEQTGCNFPNPVWCAKYETAEDEEVCAVCGKEGPGVGLKKCARCLRVKYCGTECQRKAWQEHKKVCVKDGQPPKKSPQPQEMYVVEARGPVQQPHARRADGGPITSDS